MTGISDLEISKFTQLQRPLPLIKSLRRLADREPEAAAWNMAMDEALLADLSVPLLRFYRWREPAVSLGCFEKFAPQAAQYPDRVLVRRWTGGGVVLHGEDCTFSLLIPATEPLAQMTAAQSYEAIHAALAAALRQCGVDADLAPCTAPKNSAACFAQAVQSDVLIGHRKIAGGAQRRTRAGLLHQGSVQLADLPTHFPETFAEMLAGDIVPVALDETTTQRAQAFVAAKYGTRAWTEKY